MFVLFARIESSPASGREQEKQYPALGHQSPARQSCPAPADELMSSGSCLRPRCWIAATFDPIVTASPNRPLLFLYPRWFTATASASFPRTEPQSEQGTQRLLSRRLERKLTRAYPPSQTGHVVAHRYRLSPELGRRVQTDSDSAPHVAFANVHGRWVEYRAKHDYRKLLFRQSLKQKNGRGSSQWSVVLADLNSYYLSARERWKSDNAEKSIYLPENVIQRLSGTTEENIWQYATGTGCVVHVLDSSKSKGLLRRVILQGSQRTVNEVQAFLERSAVMHETQQGSVSESGIPPSVPSGSLSSPDTPVIRSVWSSAHPSLDPNMQRRVDQIPKPKTWTIASFAKYVKELTSAPMTMSMRDQLYHEGERHQRLIFKLLENLFWDAAHHPFISGWAVNTAVEFLCRRRMIPMARALFVILQQEKIPILTSTYNIMLHGAAAHHDLPNFHYILKVMRRSFVIPNAETWVALVRATPLLDGKRAIVARMRRLGLLSEFTKTARQLAPHLIQLELADDLARRRPFSSFVESMNAMLGPGWPSRIIIEQMLDVVAERGAFGMAHEIVEFARQQNIGFRSRTYSQLLKICRHQRNVKESISLLTEMNQASIQPDRLSIGIAFRTAWHSKYYNICRVLWHWACLRGVVTREMRALVRKSLMTNDSPESYLNTSWMARVGKIAVGVEVRGDTARRTARNERTNRVNQMGRIRWLANYAEDRSDLQKRNEIVTEVIARDQSAPQRAQLERGWYKCLQDAYTTDRDWKDAEIARQRSPLWMINHAVKIPIVPRTTADASSSALPGKQSHGKEEAEASIDLTDDPVSIQDTEQRPASVKLPITTNGWGRSNSRGTGCAQDTCVTHGEKDSLLKVESRDILANDKSGPEVQEALLPWFGVERRARISPS